MRRALQKFLCKYLKHHYHRLQEREGVSCPQRQQRVAGYWAKTFLGCKKWVEGYWNIQHSCCRCGKSILRKHRHLY
jgi:hypothetical protein